VDSENALDDHAQEMYDGIVAAVGHEPPGYYGILARAFALAASAILRKRLSDLGRGK
jgi:hypothetical protein